MWLKRKGDQAENLALDYLKQAGLKLIERNYRCRLGEIDLVMQDGDDLVFIEVRYRNTEKLAKTKKNYCCGITVFTDIEKNTALPF